jgi:hypothetical protein
MTLENNLRRWTCLVVLTFLGWWNKKKNISNLKHKFVKIENFLEETYKSIQIGNVIQEKQTEKLKSKCIEITEYMIRAEISLKYIWEKTDELNKIILAILSQFNTIETYFKDKP